VNNDNFGYEYKEKAIRKRLSKEQSYKNLDSQNGMSKWTCRDKVPFNCAIWRFEDDWEGYKCSKSERGRLNTVCKHNLEDFLNHEDQKRRHRVPMLWLHDSTAAYSTSKTIGEGIQHK
ncbi:Uncharacterized protein PCOAH_00026760, partial [Plasmodium coatneyi]